MKQAITNPKLKNRLKNQKGMALLETIPILVVFVIIIAYGLGFFGVVHTGILNSIASRTYAYETLSNRANVVMFRDRQTATGSGYSHFALKETRLHAVRSDDLTATTNRFPSTARPIAFGQESRNTQTDLETHNTKIPNKNDARFRKGDGEASPAWIMVGYGICVNAECGD